MAQNSDDVLGKWQSGHGSGRIEIYKKGNKYFGKLVWLKEPADEKGNIKKDIHNPSEEKRKEPLIGKDLLLGFRYKSDNFWTDGSVYNPKNGKSYNCQMSLDGRSKLKIRAFFGISLIGKTETWTRVE